MNKMSALLVPSLLVLVAVTATNAQDGGAWAPTEIYGCNFVDDADMDDLNTVIDTWNEWMDANGTGDYAAFVLSPFYTAASFPYDVLWLGVWQNGAGLGGMQQWLAEGGEIQDDFADVIECPLHQGFAITNVKPPGEPTGIIPVEFSNCTLQEGRIGPEAGTAIMQYTEYLAENGSDSGHWILRPGPGEEGDATHSFKWVVSYTSYDSLGHDFDLFFNGGGDQRFGALTGRVMSCDSPRLYNARNIRAMADNE